MCSWGKYPVDGDRGELMGEGKLLIVPVREGAEQIDARLLLLRTDCESDGHSGSDVAI